MSALSKNSSPRSWRTRRKIIRPKSNSSKSRTKRPRTGLWNKILRKSVKVTNNNFWNKVNKDWKSRNKNYKQITIKKDCSTRELLTSLTTLYKISGKNKETSIASYSRRRLPNDSWLLKKFKWTWSWWRKNQWRGQRKNCWRSSIPRL